MGNFINHNPHVAFVPKFAYYVCSTWTIERNSNFQTSFRFFPEAIHWHGPVT